MNTSSADNTGKQAIIGPSIVVNGDISGTQDILILGQVEGAIKLEQNTVTVGAGATVRADISAASITVQGAVQGDLFGGERVVIEATGQVEGNITAERLSLEEGARLKGSIDTQGTSTAARRTTTSTQIEREVVATVGDDDSAGARNRKNGVSALDQASPL